VVSLVRGGLVYTGEAVLEDACVAWDDSGIVGVGRDLKGDVVGDCMERYAAMAFRRAATVGLVAESDIAFCPGCPPDVEQVRAVLARWASDLTAPGADGRI